MKVNGRLEHHDLGTGGWLLHTKQGKVALFGTIPVELVGQQVEIEGDELDGVSASMVGDRMVQVRSVRGR